MNEYDQIKQQLLSVSMDLLQAVKKYVPDSIQAKGLREYIADLQADFYTIVVLGEFKRGKTTFVNALLGEDLLPADVTPTTATINAIMWGEQRSLSIHQTDGSVKNMELSADNLQRFIAEGDEELSRVQYLRMHLPSSFLKGNVVLVDTPGVNDLNQQRMDVTYGFVPRADAVVFLLDATAPVKRSEYEFLSETLLKDGIDRILFVANFFDQVDEAEQEGLLEQIENRLVHALGGHKRQVLAFSARNALSGRINDDEHLLTSSGYYEVETAVEKLIQQGSQAEARLSRNKSRLLITIAFVMHEMESLLLLSQADQADIREKLREMDDVIKKQDLTRRHMEDYVSDRKNEINALVSKSLIHFEGELRQELRQTIVTFTGANFKEFVELQLPNIIKRRIKQWTEQYMPAIYKMYQMLERELAIGLSAEFNVAVSRLNIKRYNDNTGTQSFSDVLLNVEDISNTHIVAGIIAGGAGAIAMLLGGPILLPIFGMAGFPFLQKMMMTSKLDRAKEKLLPELDRSINEVCIQLMQYTEIMINQHTNAIKEAAIERFEEHVSVIYKRLQNEMEACKDSNREVEKSKKTYEDELVKMLDWKNRVYELHLGN